MKGSDTMIQLATVDIFINAAPVLSFDYLWLNPANKGRKADFGRRSSERFIS
jgi:hypothetical protein